MYANIIMDSIINVSMDAGLKLEKKLSFVWRYFFFFTYNVDPDELTQYAAFHLGLHC